MQDEQDEREGPAQGCPRTLSNEFEAFRGLLRAGDVTLSASLARPYVQGWSDDRTRAHHLANMLNAAIMVLAAAMEDTIGDADPEPDTWQDDAQRLTDQVASISGKVQRG